MTRDLVSDVPKPAVFAPGRASVQRFGFWRYSFTVFLAVVLSEKTLSTFGRSN
ncbi:hypothetical protein MED193_03767 [Roseobacter sp. MED193]|nr:hypothetical protein MED193_03767 [Roseobacter sp. MED193]